MRLHHFWTVAFLAAVSLSSCEKSEQPLVLPPANGAQMAMVTMGIDYQSQIYYDFASHSIVKTIPYNVWDFAFEAGKDGRHVFMNGAKNILVYNTHETDPSKVMQGYQKDIRDSSYKFDYPSGLPNATGIGEWFQSNNASKNEVYIVNLKASKTFKKIVIKEVTETSYTLAYGALADASLKTITIPKNDQYNYIFFSFDNGGEIVSSEPPKNSWDIVFTYYRHVYEKYNADGSDYPYLVTGVLLNSYNTTAFEDSSSGYSNVTYNLAQTRTFSNHRDVIGYDWKDVVIDMQTNTATYTTRPEKIYVVKNHKGKYWKLHFLGFYNDQKEKGSPSFEFEELE